MTIEYSGFKDESLKLEPVLSTWLELNRYCVQNWEEDVPWRYNERATLSYFAGAIWRSGGFALEEYSTQKSKSVGAEYSKKGRGDLWFELGCREYDVEAKFCRVLLTDPFKPEIEINKCINKAVADISVSRQYDDRLGCGLAACALVIDVTAMGILSSDAELEARLLAQWVAAVKSAGDACAWFIRNDRKWPLFPDGAKPYLFHPGVAVILKAVHR